MNPVVPNSLLPDAADNLPTRSSLLLRLRDVGDEVSWRTFFDTYWRLIHNVARKSGLSAQEAEDVVQDTVIAVARKMPGFSYDPKRGSFKQWLLLITRRRILDHLRRVYRALAVSDGPGTELAGQQVVCPNPTPDEAIDAMWEKEWQDNILQMALARVRQQVNPKHYQVFDYCVLQNFPPGRVAKMLGLTAPQVYLAKHRVRVAVNRAVQELETEAAHPPGP